MTDRERVTNRLKQEWHTDKRAYPRALIVAVLLLLFGFATSANDREHNSPLSYEETAR